MGGFVIFVSESEITGSKSNKMFLKGKRKNGFGNFPEAVEASEALESYSLSNRIS